MLDRRPALAGREGEAEVEYGFEARFLREHEVAVRATVLNAVHQLALTVQLIAAADLPDGLVVITAIVLSAGRDDHEIELAVAD